MFIAHRQCTGIICIFTSYNADINLFFKKNAYEIVYLGARSIAFYIKISILA